MIFDRSLIWHVVFHPVKRWWSGPHSHVSLAGYANDTWLHLDLQRGGVSVNAIYHHDEVQDFLTYLLAHHTVVRFGPALPDRSYFLRPMSCVSFTKHVLGVRSSALLPDGLLRDLVRNYGAKVLNEAETGSRDDRAKAATAAG